MMIAGDPGSPRHLPPGAKGAMMRLATSVIACVFASACDRPAAVPQAAGAPSREPLSAFVGRIWVSTEPSAALGSLRIFLPDGTLVMGSCVETYRLARWKAVDTRRIEWDEDTARIEAEVIQAVPTQLQLRLHLTSEIKEEHYRLAQVPFVCPDLR